ncbi:hypothetical protein Taro_053042, partial [Colocasia esculenta]|nr:hypothetical protein [Colocasia esculenta]
MNQQRSRRYRAAKDAEDAVCFLSFFVIRTVQSKSARYFNSSHPYPDEEEEKLRNQFQAEGIQVIPKQESEVSDSTVITPGTVFMEKLSTALEYYIRLRLNSDPGWSKLKVILSEANVPGEGEHKIMSFIRLQRNLPGYNPNTLHCLYGLVGKSSLPAFQIYPTATSNLIICKFIKVNCYFTILQDADLIMLALTTHEIHFTILREDVLSQPPAGDITLALETSFSRAQYEKLKTRESFGSAARMSSHLPKKPYQFVKIWTLRRYLEMDLRIPEAPFEVDLERQIDDFIFMCFFTGNDFLPSIPSVEVHEGAIDLLIYVYKSQFKKIGGYLVDTSKRRLERHVRESLKSLGDDSEDLTTASGQQNHASGSAAFIDGDRSNVKLGAPGWRERYYKKKFFVSSPDETECVRKELLVRLYCEGASSGHEVHRGLVLGLGILLWWSLFMELVKEWTLINHHERWAFLRFCDISTVPLLRLI